MELKDKENKTNFVTNLPTQTDFNVQKIAQMADVSVTFVEGVKDSCSSNP